MDEVNVGRRARAKATPPARIERVEACVLLLAGLDPSGGAGLAADQRGVLAAGAWPCPVTVLSTVQSTAGLVSVAPVDPRHVRAQAELILRDQRVRAVKTGALGGPEGVEVVTRVLAGRNLPLVVDPVLGATKGRARLNTQDEAIEPLMALATLVTPNALEAERLCGTSVRDLRDQREAARVMLASGPKAVLVKGGHIDGERCIDVLAVGDSVFELGSRRWPVGEVHGTGCLLASLIAGRLAADGRIRGDDVPASSLLDAVRFAKRKLSWAMSRATRVGKGQLVLRL